MLIKSLHDHKKEQANRLTNEENKKKREKNKKKQLMKKWEKNE